MTSIDRIKKIKEYCDEHGKDKTCEMFNLKRKTLNRYLLHLSVSSSDSSHEPTLHSFDFNGYKSIVTTDLISRSDVKPEVYKTELKEENNKLSFLYEGDEVIDTVEKALDKSGVDLNVWEIESKAFNTWTTTMKIMVGDGEEPIQKNNYRVALKFKKKALSAANQKQEIIEAIQEVLKGKTHFNRIENFSKIEQFPINSASPLLLELDIFDAHFGKLAWGEETGDDYDLSIAIESYVKSVMMLVQRARKVGYIGEILLPIGNDFFHTDNTIGTTTAGTRQDVDSRWQKVWKRGVQVTLDTIKTLLTYCDKLTIMTIPGNHDTMLATTLGTVIEHVFAGNSKVVVNNTAKVRKLFKFGNNGIMFTHGDRGKIADYPLLMMREFTKELAGIEHLEIHLGHFHKNKKISFISEDEFQGITVRYLRSISGTDAWHYQQGYTSGKKGAEAFLYDKNEGMIYNIKVTL